jgi:hypothetical protein
MAAFRLALILLLSLAGDLALTPILDAGDGIEESEEMLHRTRSRRALRVIQEASIPRVIASIQAVPARSADRAPTLPAPPVPPGGPARKVPPVVPDSAPASDDH